MKHFFTWLLIMIWLVAPAFAAYQPTTVDQQLIEAFSQKITVMHQENPTKIAKIAPKLWVIAASFDADSRNHYVLKALFMHMDALLNPTVNQQIQEIVEEHVEEVVEEAASEVVEEPEVIEQPTSITQPTFSSPMPHAQDLANIIDGGYVKGNPNAKYTVLEFSDFQCPFCQKYTIAGTADALVQQYAGNVNVVFVNFPLSTHPLAQEASEAAECIWDQGGSVAFYRFKEELFKAGQFYLQPTRANLDVAFDLVNTEGNMSKTAFNSCIDNGDFDAKIALNHAVAKKLSISWTPTNVFFNHETGQYKIFQGNINIDTWVEQIKALEPSL